MGPLLIAAPAFLMLAGGFSAVLVLLGGIESRIGALAPGSLGDTAYQDVREDLQSLERQGRGLGSVLGIGAAFTATLFLANLVVAADVAAHASTTVFDVEEVTGYIGYGVAALFVLMFLSTVLGVVRGLLAVRKRLSAAHVRDARDPYGPLATVAAIRRRFLLFLPLYAIVLVPMALVLR